MSDLLNVMLYNKLDALSIFNLLYKQSPEHCPYYSSE